MSFVKIGVATAVITPSNPLDRRLVRSYSVGTYKGMLAIVFAANNIMAAVEVKPEHPLARLCTPEELERTTSRFYLTQVYSGGGGPRYIKKLSYADVRRPSDLQLVFVTEAIATRFSMIMFTGLEEAPDGVLQVTLQTKARRDTLSIDYRGGASHLDEFVTPAYLTRQ